MVAFSTLNRHSHHQHPQPRRLVEPLVRQARIVIRGSLILKPSGLFLYLWALILNIGIVCLLLLNGGVDGFSATSTGWVALLLAIYFAAIIVVVARGRLSHPFLVYGLPVVAILLFINETSLGPTINILTLLLIIIGRVLDIRVLRNEREV
jgi:hypothetical protein